MADAIAVTVKDDVLWAEMPGPFTFEKATTVIRRIIEVAVQEKVQKVLIDLRSLEGEVTAIDRLRAGEYLATMPVGGLRFAIVGDEELIWPDRFFENIVVNRGVAAKVTTSLDEALQWLES